MSQAASLASFRRPLTCRVAPQGATGQSSAGRKGGAARPHKTSPLARYAGRFPPPPGEGCIAAEGPRPAPGRCATSRRTCGPSEGGTRGQRKLARWMRSNHRHLGGQVAAWPPGVLIRNGTSLGTEVVLRRFHALPRSSSDRVPVLGREWPPLLSPPSAPLARNRRPLSPKAMAPYAAKRRRDASPGYGLASRIQRPA